jgi:hypothetical protein
LIKATFLTKEHMSVKLEKGIQRAPQGNNSTIRDD